MTSFEEWYNGEGWNEVRYEPDMQTIWNSAQASQREEVEQLRALVERLHDSLQVCHGGMIGLHSVMKNELEREIIQGYINMGGKALTEAQNVLKGDL